MINRIYLLLGYYIFCREIKKIYLKLNNDASADNELAQQNCYGTSMTIFLSKLNLYPFCMFVISYLHSVLPSQCNNLDKLSTDCMKNIIIAYGCAAEGIMASSTAKLDEEMKNIRLVVYYAVDFLKWIYYYRNHQLSALINEPFFQRDLVNFIKTTKKNAKQGDKNAQMLCYGKGLDIMKL